MQPTSPSIIGGTWTILRSRWQIVYNSFLRGKLANKVGSVVLAVFIIAAAYGLFRLSRFLVQVVRTVAREQPELIAELGDVNLLFAAVPSIALSLAALPLLFGSVNFALSTLYLGRDLEMLLVAPVPMRSVFLARFAEGLATVYLLFLALLAPALAGYGQGLGYGVGFFVALVIVLLLLPLLPFSLGTLLTMLLTRYIPAKRLRDVLAVIGGLFGILVYIGTQMVGRTIARPQTPNGVEQILRFDLPVLPTAWGARALIAAGTGDLMALLFFGVLYGLSTAGLFAVCLVLAERLYLNGLAGMANTTGGRVRRRTQRDTRRSPFLRGPIGAILSKDLRTFPRDLQQLSQMLTPLAFSVFWLWQIVRGTRGEVPQGFGGIGVTATGVFICVLIASHLGLSSVSREGRSFWILQLAPVKPWTIVWAKWLLAFAPFPILGALFGLLVGLLRQPPLADILRGWLLISVIGIGVAGITTGFGAAFPRLDWQNPRKMASTQASCLGTLAYFGYTGLMLALTSVPQLAAPRFGAWVYVAGWGPALILTVVALWLPLHFGAQRLRSLEG